MVVLLLGGLEHISWPSFWGSGQWRLNPGLIRANKCFHTLSKIISRFDAEMISHFHGWTANTLAKSSIWPLAQGIELRRVKVMSLGFANCATESL